MNYEDMSNHQINKLVARKLGVEWIAVASDGLIIDGQSASVDYCGNPSDAWPVIAGNNIAILPNAQGTWLSYGWSKWNGKQDFSPRKDAIDKNPLRAAMICFLKMKDAGL